MTIVQEIINHLNTVEGAAVQITTYTKSWLYEKKHIEFFKDGVNGEPLVRQGKRFVSFRGANVKLGRWTVKNK